MLGLLGGIASKILPSVLGTVAAPLMNMFGLGGGSSQQPGSYGSNGPGSFPF